LTRPKREHLRKFFRILKTRAIHLSLLLAAFLAVGSHWDFAQVFAWGRMFALNSRSMSLQEALRDTFNPAKKCALCRAVEHARDQQEQSQLPDPKIQKEILLTFAPKSLFITYSAEKSVVRPRNWKTPSFDKATPPVPPPRAA